MGLLVPYVIGAGGFIEVLCLFRKVVGKERCGLRRQWNEEKDSDIETSEGPIGSDKGLDLGLAKMLGLLIDYLGGLCEITFKENRFAIGCYICVGYFKPCIFNEENVKL